MNTISPHIIIRNSIIKCLFLLLTTVFVANNVFPELQKYFGMELAEVQEKGELESEDQKEESKEEVNGDDFVHLNGFAEAVSFSKGALKVSYVDLVGNLCADIFTPPPEQV